jgi:hypothetical protein
MAYIDKQIILSLHEKLRLFTCVAPHIKSKGLSIDSLLLNKKLSLFTCVAPHTKSKGLPIGGPLLSKNLGFLHVYHHIQKARGS